MPQDSLTILLIEDEERDAQLFAIAVQEAHLDIRIQTVTSNQAAVQYLLGTGDYRDRLQHPFPDLVILDLFLSAALGTAFLHWCRSSSVCKHLPLVILTGTLEGDKRLEEALRQGADRAYLKPISIYDLIHIVQEIHTLGMDCKHAHARPHESIH